MKTKSIYTFIAMVVMMSTLQSVTAQQMNVQEMAAYQTKTMTEQLGLSEAQQGQVAPLNLHYSEKQAELMASEGSMFSKIGDMKKIGKEKNAALEEILTKEQMEHYVDDVEPMIRKEMRKRMKT
ncbi:MAG: hypothetical protein AAGB24_14095 [Bacteroidota bacterium]